MPSFATEVKNELARLMYEKDCCQRAELAALLRMGASMSIGLGRTIGLGFNTENAAVARKVLTLLKSVGEERVHTEVTVSRSRRLKKGNSYSVRVVPSPQVKPLLNAIGFMRGDSFNVGSDSDLLKHNCCRGAYLRGAFLGGGSVNRPEAQSHLELVTGSYSFAALLVSILRKWSMPVGFTDRKQSYVVYLKENEAIMDFMGIIGADHALDKFEAAKNLKEVRNQVNRLVNCETANLQRTVSAAARQLAAIRLIGASGGIDKLPPRLRDTARARQEHPDASMSELADMLKVGKSGINHRFREIIAIASTL